jgi:hypothetical protein
MVTWAGGGWGLPRDRGRSLALGERAGSGRVGELGYRGDERAGWARGRVGEGRDGRGGSAGGGRAGGVGAQGVGARGEGVGAE